MTKISANVKDTGRQTSTAGAKTEATAPRRRLPSRDVTPIAAAPPLAGKLTKRDQLAALVVRDEGPRSRT